MMILLMLCVLAAITVVSVASVLYQPNVTRANQTETTQTTRAPAMMGCTSQLKFVTTATHYVKHVLELAQTVPAVSPVEC